jgi:hypothetical protein
MIPAFRATFLFGIFARYDQNGVFLSVPRMTYFDNQTDTQLQSVKRRQQSNSPWLWLALVAGSVVLHLLAIHWVRAATLQARLSAPKETATPIDLIELPASPINASSSKPQPTPALASSPAKSPKTSAKTSIKQGSVSQPAAPAQPISSSTDIAVTAVTSEANIQESVTAAEPTDVQQATQPAPASPTPTPASPTPAVQPEPSSTLPIPSPTPSATPSPLITTQRIDVPIPDVTGTLPIPADGAEDLSAVVTNQVMIPSHLTASLTTDSLPTEDSQTELDEAAQPKTEVQTFSSNPTRSPCVVTPEAVQFLGKTVAMQVATDETGKVVDTVTQESSDSRAYDELATCLVKNWSFEPAIARGEPVANDGLVVRITIDRS